MNTDTRSQACEYEQAVASAIRGGLLSEEVLAHIANCAACTEVVVVTQSLLEEAASEELHVPDAGLVWRRAQATARQQAVARATRPIRIARISTLVAAFVAFPWLVVPGLNTSSWMPDLGCSLSLLDHSLSPPATATFALGILGSLAFICVSSWYVLRQE